jgi:hypothetical protein
MVSGLDSVFSGSVICGVDGIGRRGSEHVHRTWCEGAEYVSSG